VKINYFVASDIRSERWRSALSDKFLFLCPHLDQANCRGKIFDSLIGQGDAGRNANCYRGTDRPAHRSKSLAQSKITQTTYLTLDNPFYTISFALLLVHHLSWYSPALLDPKCRFLKFSKHQSQVGWLAMLHAPEIRPC